MANPTLYTKEQLIHLHINPSVSLSSQRFCHDSETKFIDTKFKDILNVIYSSENSVSLCNDFIFNLSENVPSDVLSFVQNWLLKAIEPLPSAPNDELAFASIIPSSPTFNDVRNVIQNLDNIVKSVQDTVQQQQTE